jgi:hypothetical protein
MTTQSQSSSFVISQGLDLAKNMHRVYMPQTYSQPRFFYIQVGVSHSRILPNCLKTRYYTSGLDVNLLQSRIGYHCDLNAP